MTLLELVTYLRRSLLDDIPSDIDWENVTSSDAVSENLRWANEELVDFINRAENEVHRRVHDILDADVDISIDDSTALYTIPSYVLRGGIREALLVSNGRPLDEISFEDIRYLQNWRTNTGTPHSFALDYQSGKILLYPIPTETSDTVTLTCYRGKKAKMTFANWDTDEPEISPEDDQYLMLYHAAELAYSKDDSNIEDQQMVAKYKALFDNEFPPVSVHAEIQRRRQSFRSGPYVGYPLKSLRRRYKTSRRNGGW